MITLRELRESDAPYMLEWMHDPDIARCFQQDMTRITMSQAESFCRDARIPESLRDGMSLHYAIVDDVTDEYLGTVSLKSVDLTNSNAEFAISTRKKAWGKGVASAATRSMLHRAFNVLGLHRVYLNVLSDNERAIRLYEACGFQREGVFRDHLFLNGHYVDEVWYAIVNEEDA